MSSPNPLAPAVAIAIKGSDASRDELKLAISVCQAEADRNPADARAWALLARTQVCLYENYERNPERFAIAEGAARNAMSLAPQLLEARLAQALVFRAQPATTGRCLELLRQLEREAPDNPDVLVALAQTQLREGDPAACEDSMRLCDRALAARPGDPAATVWKAWALSFAGRFDEADALRAAAIKRGGSPGALFGMFYDLALNRGEIEQAKALLAQFPADLMFNDGAVRLVTLFWLGQREPEKALAFVEPFPRDLVEDFFHTIPKGYLVGKAHAQAGRMAAARLEWRKALETVDRLLATPREQKRLRNYKARLHFLLGETEEADRQAELYLQTLGPDAAAADNVYVNQLLMELGRASEAVSRFEKSWNKIASTATGRSQMFRRMQNLFPLMAASPEFQSLLAKAETEAAQEKKK